MTSVTNLMLVSVDRPPDGETSAVVLLLAVTAMLGIILSLIGNIIAFVRSRSCC